MKTTILADGTLSITPESDLEAYALDRWSRENITSDWYCATRVPPAPKLILDCSEYADRMGLFVTAGELKL
ncbi:hypothetical protein SAMN05446935_6144 [Burkholderia sp. YR290]|nr:hypothetical protein SAMN05446935_6144 [Burkholderia sp. YR290]